MKINDLIKNKIIERINQSIRVKSSILILVVALLPLIAATVITFKNSKDAMEQKIISQNADLMAWVYDDFTSNIDRMNGVMTAFFFDRDMPFYDAKAYEGSPWKNEAVQFFKTKMRSNLLANLNDINTIHYYSYQSNKHFSANYEKDFIVESIDSAMIEKEMPYDVDNELYYIDEKSDGALVSGPYLKKFYKRFENSEVLGALTIKLNMNLFERASEVLLSEEGSVVGFFDSKGRILFSSDTSINTDKSKKYLEKIKKEKEKDYYIIEDEYIFYKQVSPEIYLIKTIPRTVATDFYRNILLSQLLIIILTGVIALIVVFVFGARLTKPLVTLAESMENIDLILQDDIKPLSFAKSKDEIWMLEQSYQSMIKRIKALIDKEYWQQIEIQNAHLLALQAQINPHFMYNTLQMIGSMAVENNIMEIYDVVSAFAKMMRYSMQLTEELVLIEQELENMNQYLQIQQKRFDNKLIIEQEYPELIRKNLIPKLSLQPIVENCFKYGFATSRKIWCIKVKMYEQADDLIITIKDNGKGINDEDMKEIQEKLTKHSKNSFFNNEKIGLKNIDSRIKLHFGDEEKYGLKIESKQNEYTKVTMMMKVVRGEKGEECLKQ